MLRDIIPMIPEHKVYNEAFFGGGAIFFAKKEVHNETINDMSNFVINFYRQAACNFDKLKELIEGCLISRTIHKRCLEVYYQRTPAGDLERAFAFWYLSNFSYACKLGGGIKYSNDQHTNVAKVLKRKKIDFCLLMKKRLENAQIECNDALKVMRSRNVESAFHYIDPPYMHADQGHYTGYNEDQFENLLMTCEEIKGKFLLSNYRSKMLDSYVKDNRWNYIEITKNNPGMRSKKPQEKIEVLVWNYEINHIVNNQLKLFNNQLTI